ncbi:MAG: hypothetical protein KIS92_26835, partial [Planctomycetota bacterium]|nr:hypothetical protein [Planctomycetota bacterium]
HAARTGVFQLLTDRPLPKETVVKLQWRLPEKPSLPSIIATVEKTWVPEPKATGASGIMASPIDVATRPAPPPGEHQAAHDTLVLSAKDLPPEVLNFKPGALVTSDLQNADQIVRA